MMIKYIHIGIVEDIITVASSQVWQISQDKNWQKDPNKHCVGPEQ